MIKVRQKFYINSFVFCSLLSLKNNRRKWRKRRRNQSKIVIYTLISLNFLTLQSSHTNLTRISLYPYSPTTNYINHQPYFYHTKWTLNVIIYLCRRITCSKTFSKGHKTLHVGFAFDDSLVLFLSSIYSEVPRKVDFPTTYSYKSVLKVQYVARCDHNIEFYLYDSFICIYIHI